MRCTDRELEKMPYSQLLLIMVKHAEAHDKRVKESQDVFEWDMDIWAIRLDDVCRTCVAGAMLYDRVGAAAFIADSNARALAEEWMRRVDDLRTGMAIDHLDVSLGTRDGLAVWFEENKPDPSAAWGHPWNENEDGAFYREFADKLDEVGQ